MAAVLTLPASAVNPVASFESPILEITPPNPLESFVPNASRLLSAALVSLPNPLVSFDPPCGDGLADVGAGDFRAERFERACEPVSALGDAVEGVGERVASTARRRAGPC